MLTHGDPARPASCPVYRLFQRCSTCTAVCCTTTRRRQTSKTWLKVENNTWIWTWNCEESMLTSDKTASFGYAKSHGKSKWQNHKFLFKTQVLHSKSWFLVTVVVLTLRCSESSKDKKNYTPTILRSTFSSFQGALDTQN